MSSTVVTPTRSGGPCEPSQAPPTIPDHLTASSAESGCRDGPVRGCRSAGGPGTRSEWSPAAGPGRSGVDTSGAGRPIGRWASSRGLSAACYAGVTPWRTCGGVARRRWVVAGSARNSKISRAGARGGIRAHRLGLDRPSDVVIRSGGFGNESQNSGPAGGGFGRPRDGRQPGQCLRAGRDGHRRRGRAVAAGCHRPGSLRVAPSG